MSGDEQLYDLSLFSASPTDDRHFAVPGRQLYDEIFRPPREYRRPLPVNVADKPLPPLPQRRLCPGVSVPRNCDVDSPCILARLRRTVTPPATTRESPTTIRDNNLQQRRQPASIPQLTLSVPQSSPRNRNTAPAMVWMPDEQMWLFENDVQRETFQDQTAYPSPPAYSPPRYQASGRSRSVPTTAFATPFSLTPPLTPIQTQLQSLIQPPEDERMSPLFQEAINSVPMPDPMDMDPDPPPFNPSPPQDLGPQRAHTNHESSVRDLSPRAPDGWHFPARSVSMGNRSSYARSDTSDSRSFQSARESISEDLSQQENSARRWQGLARRIARPSSAN